MEVPSTTGVTVANLSAEVVRSRAPIVDFDSTERITVCRYKDLMQEVNQRQTEKIDDLNETARENVEILVCNVKVTKMEIVKMFVEGNLSLTNLEDHVRSLQNKF